MITPIRVATRGHITSTPIGIATDGFIVDRGNLGFDMTPEKTTSKSFQKRLLQEDEELIIILSAFMEILE